MRRPETDLCWEPVIGPTRDIRRLQERSLRVDAVVRMSTPPAHLSGKTLLPGALLAVLVTVAALFALAVVIAVGPDGPVRLWLDDGGSAVSLKARESSTSPATPPGGPAGLLPGASNGGLVTGVSLSSPVTAADRPGAVQLRANTRAERRTVARTPARTPAARRPRAQAPASTPSPRQPVSQTTATAPAPPAPASSVEKTRSRGTAPATTEVPKQRVNTQTATPAPTAPPTTGEAPGPTPRSVPAPTPAPVTEMRPVQGGVQPSAGVVADDGTLHRVPPTHP